MVAATVLNLPRAAQAEELPTGLPYCIVDTGQVRCYNDRAEIKYPKSGEAFFGQDAQYKGKEPSYRDNGDGTVSDLNTGLIWQADPGSKKTYTQAIAGSVSCRTGGHRDWRLPTVKELYSLILFSGSDPDPFASSNVKQKPFIDTNYFRFKYGKQSDGDRVIDSQWATNTLYRGRVMNHMQAMFGVNFADGRIKGYPVDTNPRGRTKKFYVIYVRGNEVYGKNDFVDNEDGTVTDRATGLTWMQVDSAALKAGHKLDGKLNWQEALHWAENLIYAGHSDWRLPNAKELQSIVDYARSPDTTKSAAIDPIFKATPIINEGGKTDFAHYWTSTSHTRATSASAGVYIAFGRALGFMSFPRSMSGQKTLLDVHGAGAQRSDPKSGSPATFADGRGPQGDVIRIYNLVRCVRSGTASPRETGPKVEMTHSHQGPGTLVFSPQCNTNGPQLGLPFGGSFRQHAGAPSGEDFVRRLDRDDDGKISRREFDGPANHFPYLDLNHNGYLSIDEAAAVPPPQNKWHPRE